jgi:hypothetical protein
MTYRLDKLEINGDVADIRISYDVEVTKEDVKSNMLAFYFRASIKDEKTVAETMTNPRIENDEILFSLSNGIINVVLEKKIKIDTKEGTLELEDGRKLTVSPKEGEIVPEETVFKTRLGEPLYPGLPYVHGRSPHALPHLIEDLKGHEKGHPELIGYLIEGLEEIVGGTNDTLS